MMELELSTFLDGIVYLDSADGDTRVFQLFPDGTASEITFDDDDTRHATPINLVLELRAMAQSDRESNP